MPDRKHPKMPVVGGGAAKHPRPNAKGLDKSVAARVQRDSRPKTIHNQTMPRNPKPKTTPLTASQRWEADF